MKRTVSIIICLLLILTIFPSAAFAAEADAPVPGDEASVSVGTGADSPEIDEPAAPGEDIDAPGEDVSGEPYAPTDPPAEEPADKEAPEEEQPSGEAEAGTETAVAGAEVTAARLTGEYVLVLNTNPDPTVRRSTGPLVFSGTGSASQTTPPSQSYAYTPDIAASTVVSGYTKGQHKTIGFYDYVCIGVGAHCYIWMEAGLYDDYAAAGKLDTAANEAINVYEGKPYQTLKTLAGGEIPAKDGTGKLSVLFELDGSASGYFAGEDYITAIHLRAKPAADYVYGDMDSYGALLAHEGQHALFQYLTCGGDAGREYPLRWLNEGLAVMAMDWVWGGDNNGVEGWLDSVTDNGLIREGGSLAYANYRDDTGLNYGLPYLFVRYIAAQAAREYDPVAVCRKFYETTFSGDTAAYLNAVFSSLGLTDADGSTLTYAKALEDFYIASVKQARTGVYGFYGDTVVKTKVSYPIFNGASGSSYTLSGTGALVLRTNGGAFTPPPDVSTDIVFVAFDDDSPSYSWSGGTGTSSDPYQIRSSDILSAMSFEPAAYYKLAEDIDLSGKAIFSAESFSGDLDGDGHTISGVGKSLIYRNSGVVHDLNVVLDMTGTFGGYVGGVVSDNAGTVRNVHVTGSLTGRLTGAGTTGWMSVGAVVGNNGMDVYECSSDVTMSFGLPSNNIYIGQIAGDNNSGRVYDCQTAGSITAAQTSDGAYALYAGGLVGRLWSQYFTASLKTSYSITRMTVSSSGAGNICKVGRIVGYEGTPNSRSGYVESCCGFTGMSAAGGTQSSLAALSDSACLKTDAQLKTQSTFTGWDFTNTWNMPAGGYPSLTEDSAEALTVSVPDTSYYIGEKLDLTGATVTLGPNTVAMTAAMLFSEPDTSTAGTKTVNGSYSSKPFSFTVTVSAPAASDVTALTVKTAAKSSYYAGQRFDATGAVLTATVNGSSVDIYSGYTLGKTTALSVSDTQMTYSYYGKTASQTITVAPMTITGITRTGEAADDSYSDGEALSLSGLKFRLTYSDNTAVENVTPAQFSRYGLKLIYQNNGAAREISVSARILDSTEDDGASLYAYYGSDPARFMTTGIRCYAMTISVGRIAHMADQVIEIHRGIDEYVYSDPIESGSGDYTTTPVSGTLPAGMRAELPGSEGRTDFYFYGTPTQLGNYTLIYQIRDNTQNQQFKVTVYLKVLAPSEECDILSATLGGYPCIIGENTIKVVVPTGTGINALTLNADRSAGSSQEPWNGTRFNCTGSVPPTVTVTSQSGSSTKVYTVTAAVATGSALSSPTGLSLSGSTVGWTPVSGAGGYLIELMRISGGADNQVSSHTVTSARFDMESVITATGRYYINVIAFDPTNARPASAPAPSDIYYSNRTPVWSITLSGPTSIVVGRTGTYTAAVTPSNAGNTSVIWSVAGGTGAASITPGGVLTGTRAGTVTVKATAADGNGAVKTFGVTILPQSSAHTVTVDVAGISKASRALWIDGVEYKGSSLTVSGTRYTVSLTTTTATNAIVFSYNSLTEADPHKVYPNNMAVWLLKYQNGAYIATRTTAFDNLLQYAGSSIRITGEKGIRMITSVPTAAKTALTGGGLNGYKLLEYGTAVAWKSELGSGPLVLGRSYTKSKYAYKKGVADPIFRQANGLTQYTNVLTGFNNAKCVPDLMMRPYMIMQTPTGGTITLYGGMIERSIGYIAYQNRRAFTARTAAYEYIWGIIKYVYGNTYDSEYRG